MPVPSIAVLAAVALGVGAVGGVALEQADVLTPLEETEVDPVRIDRVDVLDCPEGVAVATLSRGDRVVATGRTEDDRWIEIRSPLDLDDRVWLPAPSVVPDGDRSLLDDLPTAECERTELATTTTSTSSTTTSSTSTSTSTTTTSTTTTLPTTTTSATIAPDVTPPTLGTPSAQAPEIVEASVVDPSNCISPSFPLTSLISVTATDDRPGVAVTMTFSSSAVNGALSVSQQGQNFVGTLGPFNDAAQQFGGSTTITVTVRATDTTGNASPARTTNVVLFECESPP